MLLYKFEAATPWRIALTKDETGATLPSEGAPWRADGSLEVESGSTFMGVPLAEILGTIQATDISTGSRRPNEMLSRLRRLRSGVTSGAMSGAPGLP